MVLEIIFWILLILSFLGFWCPDPYVRYVRGVDLVLIAIIGLKLFGVPH